jgi:RHH-type transcriptional regulator, rel operon repressor / antitoxin RelB
MPADKLRHVGASARSFSGACNSRGFVLYCTHMNTDTFSVRVGRSTKTRLEKLANSTGRSRSFLAAEAVVAYLDTNEWQVGGISKALSSLDRGKGIAHERVSEWVRSWETRKERRSPRGV